ncbi:MAG: ComEC/Rec2 family competence protein, partial [Planctomycetota bacterium]
MCLPGSAPTRRPRGFISARGPSNGSDVAEQRVHPDQWVRLDGAGAIPLHAELGSALRAWRMKLAERFLSIDHFRTARLLASISFGLVLQPRREARDPASFDGGDADLFTRTGTRHLLAVSGLHVGLMAWMLFGPLSRAIRFALHALLHR